MSEQNENCPRCNGPDDHGDECATELQRKLAGGNFQIRPTGTCFDDALDFLTWRIKQESVGRAAARFHLVHGICLAPEGPDKGEPFAHAWVEETMPLGEVVVWQDGIILGTRIQYSMARQEFVEKLRVQTFTRYSVYEAARENARHRTFGPWILEYQALCGGARVFEPEEA